MVLTDFVLTTQGVTLTIKNVGDELTNGYFWVDVYIDPITVPTKVNDTWEFSGGEGAAWGIETLLAPNEELVLTLDGLYYDPLESGLTLPLADTAQVYVFVDAVGDPTYGGVLEIHEIQGTASNNIQGPFNISNVVTAQGAWPQAQTQPRAQPGLSLPVRR